jgi:carboxylate-amine ligase
MTACVAQAALDYDEGAGGELLGQRQIEENLWRAIRYGLDGEMLDFERRTTVPTRAVADALLAWTEPARRELELDVEIPAENGAQRARREHAAGSSIEDIYREAVADTRRTYAPQGVPVVDD